MEVIRRNAMAEPFEVKDCALIALATGMEAQNLRELADRIRNIPTGSIYYHFWGGMLRPTFDEPEYQNDFAAWAWRSLHDPHLAERLALIDPTGFKEMEDLRREILDVVEERLDESPYIPWAKTGQRFHFEKSQIVVFDTGQRLQEPHELVKIIPHLSLGSVFYHMIDARRRTDRGRSDFSEWLSSFGDKYKSVVESLSGIDPYFTNLMALRNEVEAVLKKYDWERGE